MADYLGNQTGLDIDENIDIVKNKSTVIDETSTDNEIATAKAIVDYVEGKTINPTQTPPVQLKAISKVNQTITTNVDGTVPVAEITQESNKITIVNGEITFAQDGFYRIQLQLNLSNSNNTELDTWAEYYNGSTWENLADSGNIIDTANINAGNKFIESTFVVSAGFKVRLKIRATSGSATLATEVLSNGVSVPSLTILSYELDKDVFSLDLDTENLTQPLLVGSGNNFTKFEEDGTLVAEGDATCWDEISKSLVGRNLDTASGRIDYNYTELTIDYADNARYPDEPIGVVTQMNHSRELMTEIRPHLHWIQNQNVMPNILIAYRAYNNGDNVPTTFTLKALTNSDNVYAYTSGSMQQITEFNLPLSVGEGLELSGTFDCKIYRDTANNSGLFVGSDTYTGVLSVKYFDIHFIKNMMGSREEFVK